MRKATWRWLVLGVLLVVALFGALALGSCGDGGVCDCCDTDFDCEFGLQCVDLQGGSGKVCGEIGINYCDTSC